MILPITGKVGDFVDGELVTGQTSGAKGIAATHFLRCQDLVNPSNVVVPVKFKIVFEPAGVPPPEAGIALTGVEGTFQNDEKVIGQTSGAYAYVNYPQWHTLSPEESKYIIRSARTATWEDAIDDYINDPYWSISTYYNYEIRWFTVHGSTTSLYQITGAQNYLTYDTSAVSSALNAKLRFTVLSLELFNTDEKPLVQVYKHDFGTVGTNDWTGGTKIAEQELVEGESTVEITIDPSHINFGGLSQYRITIDRLVNNDYFSWPEVYTEWHGYRIHSETGRIYLQYEA